MYTRRRLGIIYIYNIQVCIRVFIFYYGTCVYIATDEMRIYYFIYYHYYYSDFHTSPDIVVMLLVRTTAIYIHMHLYISLSGNSYRYNM